MDLKQIVRAAVNRWRNKSFSLNETDSEPTSARTESNGYCHRHPAHPYGEGKQVLGD